jgi:hypothetical protein
MIIEIRKVVRPLPLSGFAPEYGEDTVSIWVNPNREALVRYELVRKQAEELKNRLVALGEQQNPDKTEAQAIGTELTGVNELLYAWYAEIWSQSPDPAKHVSGEQVRELAERCEREDPTLWFFLISGTWRLINEHLSTIKKG